MALCGPRPVRPVLLDHTASIGRARDAARLLVDTRVSHQHARVEVTPEGLLLISDGVAELSSNDSSDFGSERAVAEADANPNAGLTGMEAALDAWLDPAAALDDASALLLRRE